MSSFKPSDVSLTFFGHSQKSFARLPIRQRRGQTPALVDPLPHACDYLQIVFGHVAKIHMS